MFAQAANIFFIHNVHFGAELKNFCYLCDYVADDVCFATSA